MRTLVVILTMAVALAGQITPELEAILEQAGPSDMVGVIVQTQDQADMSAVPADLTFTPGVYFLDLKTFETSTCTKLVHLSTRLK